SRVVGDRLRTVMSSIMRRRRGLIPSVLIAKAPVCSVVDSQTPPDRQGASLYKPSAPLSTGITLALSGLYRASGSVQSASPQLTLLPESCAAEGASDEGKHCHRWLQVQSREESRQD